MRKPVLVLACLSAVAIGLALAQTVNLKIETYVLSNGMRVILHQDRSLPKAAVNLYFRVGSKDEPARRSGFAHLFEHLMFMGTQSAPNFDNIMEAEGGENNAATWSDWTKYYSSGPASSLPTLLWLEADRLANLGRNIDQKKLDLQRNVVLNELRQGVTDTPYGEAENEVVKWLYPSNHPYHTPVIGSEEDLRAATVEDVKRFFSTYYGPNNAIMTVAGDFDVAVVKAQIKSQFERIPRGNDVQRKPVPEPVIIEEARRATYADRVDAPRVIMAWHSPKATTNGDAEMDVAAQILAGGVSSRLYGALVDEGLASEVSAYQVPQVLGSYFQIEATAAEGVTASKLESVMDEALKDFQSKGVTNAELKRQIILIEKARLEALQTVDAKADALSENQFYYGEANAFEKNLARYRKITASSLQSTVKTVLNPKARVILTVVPSAKRGDDELLLERPASSPISAVQLPNPNEFTLASGAKLVYFQRDLPLTRVAAIIAGGTSQEVVANSGRTAVMTQLLTRGAGTRSAQAFQNALDDLGATLEAGQDWDNTQVSLSVLTKNLGPALNLFGDALSKPRFDAADFKTVQNETLAALKERNNDLADVARQVALREFWGANHPVGHPIAGLSSGVKSLTLETIKRAHTEQFVSSNVTIYAAGSLAPTAFKTQLEGALKGLKKGKALEPVIYGPPATLRQRVVIVDRPGSSQTAVRFLMPAPNSSDANTNRLESVMQILGGSFTSRLNQNLREDKGYTYGAGASLVANRNFGYIRASASVEQSVTGAALKEFLGEFARLKQGDFTADEAKRASGTRLNGIIANLSSLEGLLATAVDQRSRGSSLSGLSQSINQFSNFDASALNQLAPNALPLEQSVLVLVGDKAKILPQLEGLGLPTIEEVKFE
jgi:zinc protease